MSRCKNICSPDWKNLLIGLSEREDTSVNDGQASCAANDTDDQCMVRFGGLFDGANSSTYHFYPGLTAPGLPQSSSSEKTADDTFTDAISLSPGLSLTEFPVRINRAFNYLVSTYNYVGLSPTSILMNSLVTGAQVSSNSIGYCSGWAGADITHDVDGNLVLGGYDRAKIAGPNATQSIARTNDCLNGFKLRLTNISLNLSNGRNISLMNTSDVGHTACIDTVSDSIRLTPSLWSSFLRSSGSTETGRVEDGFNREGFLIAADTA
ncbi:MAG: hypothetical protein OHK93_005410 [Ramalina farinacea]|uniref:Uncharacterized protein n=1 Tax=Ramalina farinacea TaxID=258253 RepID=A0AA43QIX2_9LECA|nr:hypothetical protein [Ramalina farinacea]